MWWSVRQPLFPYKVGHPHMPSTRAARGLRHFCPRSLPVTRPYAPTLRPLCSLSQTAVGRPRRQHPLLCPSTPPPTGQSPPGCAPPSPRRLTVRGVATWRCG
ncbi:hypothetical protein BO83DRAFT_463814, partial [Aspergillus eucalypticola CBS 122712]